MTIDKKIFDTDVSRIYGGPERIIRCKMALIRAHASRPRNIGRFDLTHVYERARNGSRWRRVPERRSEMRHRRRLAMAFK